MSRPDRTQKMARRLARRVMKEATPSVRYDDEEFREWTFGKLEEIGEDNYEEIQENKKNEDRLIERVRREIPSEEADQIEEAIKERDNERLRGLIDDVEDTELQLDLFDYGRNVVERGDWTKEEVIEHFRSEGKDIVEGTEKKGRHLATKVEEAVGRVGSKWRGSDVVIRPQKPAGGTFGGPVTKVSNTFQVHVGTDKVYFTYFAEQEMIEDVLDAGSFAFSSDDVEQDYFNLIREMRDPGSTQSDETIVLYTARPTKDRDQLKGGSSLPSELFLTDDPGRALGIARELSGGGMRDVWKVKIKTKYLHQTLDSPSGNDYQIASDRPVPVESKTLMRKGV